jgi:hypothetical protein
MQEHEPVRTFWNKVFFEEQLDSICQSLQDSPWTCLVWANSVLHAGDDFAFEPHHQHCGDQANNENQQYFHEDYQ